MVHHLVFIVNAYKILSDIKRDTSDISSVFVFQIYLYQSYYYTKGIL